MNKYKYKIGDLVRVLNCASADVITGNVYRINNIKDDCRIREENGIGYHLDNGRHTSCWLLDKHIVSIYDDYIKVEKQYYFY